jgi:hypothetical protein
MTEAGKSKVNGFAVPELTILNTKLDALTKKVDDLVNTRILNETLNPPDDDLVYRVFGLKRDQLTKLERKLRTCHTVEEVELAQSKVLYEGMSTLSLLMSLEGTIAPMKVFTRGEKLIMAAVGALCMGVGAFSVHSSGVARGRKQVIDSRFDVAISHYQNGEPRVEMTMAPGTTTTA